MSISFQELKKTIASGRTGDQFSLELSQLNSHGITAIAADFFPQGKFTLGKITGFDEAAPDKRITIRGTGIDLPFTGMLVEARFYLVQDEAHLMLTATGDAQWTLDTAFPILQTSLIGKFVYGASPPPQLTLHSLVQGDTPTGLSFSGAVDLDNLAGGLNSITGRKQQNLTGQITVMDNGSSLRRIALLAQSSAQVDLGIATVEQLSFEVGSHPVYNVFSDRYSCVPYIKLAAVIPFQAQGKKYHLPVAVQITDLNDDFRFSADLTESIDAALHEISSLTNGIGFNEIIPKDFQLSQILKIRDFFFDLNFNHPHKISLIGVDIENAAPWTICHTDSFQHDLTVENIILSFRLQDPFGAKSVWLGLQGEIAIGAAGRLLINTHYPDFAISGSLKEGTSLRLNELMAVFAGSNTDLPEVELGELNFCLSAADYHLKAELDGHWPIGDLMQVEQLRLELAYIAGKPKAFISGLFNIAKVNIAVSAEYAGSGCGWQFEGGTGTGQKIPIGILINDLANIFGGITLPEAIQKIALKNLKTSFNTKTFKSSFTCEGTLPLENDSLDTNFTIDINPQDDVYQKHLGGAISFSGISFKTDIDLAKTSQFKANAAHVSLAVICEKILQTKLPAELPDLVLEKLEFSIGTHQSISLSGLINLEDQDQKLKLHDLEAPLTALEFGFTKTKNELKASVKVQGRAFPKFQELNMELQEYSFEFAYSKKSSESGGNWLIGGSLGVLAFERFLYFKAEARIGDTQTITFQSTTEPVVTKAFFASIPELNYDSLIQKMRDNKYLDEKNILTPKLDISTLNLGNEFQTCLESIKTVLTKVQKNNQPLITLPNLCEINPTSLAIDFQRQKDKPAEWKFSAVTDFKLFNFFEAGQMFLTVEKGDFSAFYEEKQQGFQFDANHAQIYPLKLMPGLTDSLIATFGESTGSKPKTDAFLSMFLLELEKLKFIHDQKHGWNIAGNLTMKLTAGLQTALPDLYNILEQLFPSVGDDRAIGGEISISSQKGLRFEITNNSGLEIPNLLKAVADSIPLQYKQQLQSEFQKIGIPLDIDNLLDLGPSFLLLEKFSITIHDRADFKVGLAMGLPAKLNDYIFSKSSKLHGIIKTYDKQKLGKQKTDKTPDDNLLRASLTVSTEGVSGQLENFDLIEKDKLKEVAGEFLSSCYEEKTDYVTFDFDGLVDGKIPDEENRNYGKVKFDKPKFKLDLKTASFEASGGIHVESEQLKIPVRPVIQKILALLPLEKYNLQSLTNLADLLTDGIAIRSIAFFKDGKLNLSDLELWLKELIHEDFRDQFQIPQAFKTVIEKEVGRFANSLPQPFKDYLEIILPKGFKFNIVIPADQSISFQFEVDQSDNDSSGLKDYLQLIVPDPTNPMYIYGLRLRKIGLGTALFNQFLRLDLSLEVDIFNTIHLAAGLILPDKASQTDELIKLMLPDKNKFCLHLEAKNLLTLIILQTQIPIPVPLFYDRLYAGYFGLEGIETEYDLQFSAPQFDLQKIIKHFTNLKSFFTSKEDSLPVPSHALAQLEGAAQAEPDIIPAFNAGPFYFRLPGYLGYELVNDAATHREIKQPIMLGFRKQLSLNFMDLVGTGANLVKFTVYPLFDPTVEPKVPVKSAKDPTKIVAKVSPVNYLIQYLPLEDRLGLKKIKLFFFLDIELAWAFTTPQEFTETAYPKLKAKYNTVSGSSRYAVIRRESTAAQLLELLSQNDTGHQVTAQDDGLALFFRGGLQISDSFILETALGMTTVSSGDFRAGISFYGYLVDIIEARLLGFIQISPQSEKEALRVSGQASLALFNHPMFQGSFELTNEQFRLSGMLDLFPENWPVKLNGYIDGYIGKNKFLIDSAADFQLGLLKVSARIQILTESKRDLFKLDLDFLYSALHITYRKLLTETGGGLEFDLSCNALNSILQFSAQLRMACDTGNGIALSGNSSLLLNLHPDFTVKIGANLSGTLDFKTGFLGITAGLTDGSYLFGKDCRITGSVAFYYWSNTGDFALTMGGYHPQYRSPSHYPAVSRLGIFWPVDHNTSITGDAYLALTPSCLMAGGRLNFTFEWWRVKAWFIAQADFICQWRPVSYSAKLNVTVGLSYRGLLKTYTAELGSELELWGPSLGGRMHVQWFIISFDIHFGNPQKPAPPAFTLDDFYALLPDKDHICNIKPDRGIYGTKMVNNCQVWLINPDDFAFATETAIPASRIVFNNQINISGSQPDIHFRPLNLTNIQSVQQVTIMQNNQPYNELQWQLSPLTGNLPDALWGDCNNTDLNRSPLVNNALTGIQINLPTLLPDAAITVEPQSLQTDNIQLGSLPRPTAEGYTIQVKPDSRRLIQESIASGSSANRRNEIFQYLQQQGFSGANDSLEQWAKNTGNMLTADPLVVA